MKIKSNSIRIILLFLFLQSCVISRAQIFTVFTIGDSTMADKKDPDENPERGWAQMLPEFLPDSIKVQNHAVNGRSTRSFINEGKWKAVLESLRPRDMVFIQFGHNDQKLNDPKRYTNPHTAYRNNLIRFIKDSRIAGATPVLFTSIVRRNFNEHGTLIDTHGDYPLVVRLVGQEFSVPVIDLQYMTEQLEESYGVEKSQKLHLHFKTGEHPYYPEGKEDDTHLSVLGARTIAKMVVEEMERLGLLSTSGQSFIDEKVSKILNKIQLPEIPDYQISLSEFGGQGNGKIDNKKAFDKAIKHLHDRNGGILTVPPGDYLVNGPIHLESNINLNLQEGATIHFGSNSEDYLPVVATSWEGTFIYNYSPLIYANDKSNIALTGAGTINGNGDQSWAAWKEKENASKMLSRDMNHQGVPLEHRVFGKGHFLRPQLIQLKDCRNILIEDVHITNSPFWCTHLLRSDNITIRGISFNAHNKNNDGIDLEYASNVLIEDVDFDNADDNIAIKAGRDHEGRFNSHTPSENIVIRNCRMKGLHAFVIGSEMSAGVKSIYIDNCWASGFLKRGIYIKTNSDRGGYIEDIHISNINLDQTEDCIFITANYHGEGSGEYPSKISQVNISNVSCDTSTGTGIVVEGFPSLNSENIFLDHIKIKKAKNAITLVNTKGVTMNEVIIGDQAGTPSAVK